jgi:hypothetical protein
MESPLRGKTYIRLICQRLFREIFARFCFVRFEIVPIPPSGFKKNITATDSTLKYHAVKRLGLAYSHFEESVPVFKRLGGQFSPKNSSF